MNNKLFAALGGLLLVLSPLAASAAKDTAAGGAWIEVELGLHKLIHDTRQVSRVATGDPAIADVTVGGLHDVLVNGKKLGVTNLTIWNKGVAAPRQFRVRVVPAQHPRTTASKGDPEMAGAQISPGHGLEGRLPNLAAHRRAKLATLVQKEGEVADSSDIALGSQVQTSVKIAELSRSTAQRFGLNIFKNSSNTLGGVGAPGSVSGVDSTGGRLAITSNSGFQPFRDAYSLVFGNPRDGLVGLLNVLEGKGLARILAEPTLVATSGQTASYLVGGEFPIPVVQGGQSSSVTVEYKEFGVRLSLTPTVLSRDRISLKVAPEVSDIDFSAGIQAGGVTVPALRVRRTETTIELGDGESFVISGLVSNTLRRNVDKVPWLGQVPILGAFFRSTQLDQEERELIMVVTPQLVRPMARSAKLPPLPGARYEGYRPSAGQLVFEETGDADVGFSK